MVERTIKEINYDSFVESQDESFEHFTDNVKDRLVSLLKEAKIDLPNFINRDVILGHR